ncbi:hypothetical protein WG922_11900 [Ramlibacter sp. AN1015]|uniref:hypothetical protein n=1 Tax=Ramlibacter sp. AN1015 TaxID=3133428 RepID=UPI0030BBFD1D
MSPLTYYALWLLGGLLVVAIVSASLTWLMRRREQALVLAQALSRHAVWVAAQRSKVALELQRDEADAALQQAAAVQSRWFPALAGEFRALLEIDRRLDTFLAAQHALRMTDAEAWLESDHDEHFLALWREYLVALDRLTERLARLTGEAAPSVEHGSSA